MNCEVLIVGAGPTGLVLALWLTRLGVKIRIIDKSHGPGETSRAMVVQARTLEFYRQMKIADGVVSQGLKVQKMTLRKNTKKIVQIPLGDIGKELSPFPYLLGFPQDAHERYLVAELEKINIQVERETEFKTYESNANGVVATVIGPQGEETINCAYLCGCDGASSVVRGLMDVGFSGGTYSHIFYVADTVPMGNRPDGIQMCMTKKDFCLIFPMKQSDSVRLIGIVPQEFEKKTDIHFEDIEADIHKITGYEFESIHWFSTYRAHHRIAGHFRKDRAFLLGDAGHIHSPAGGQGMNTGLGDAINLAWKLASVLQSRAKPEILETYEQERILFARTLVKTTDKVFRVMASRSEIGAFFRSAFLPILAPLFFRIHGLIRVIFKLVSQVRINYRQSPLSHGRIGRLRAGDRLPWVLHSRGDNFDPLCENDWQLHVYGKVQDHFVNDYKKTGFALYEFPWNDFAEHAGLRKDVIYFVRPDGHIGFACKYQEMKKLSEYIERFGLKPRK